MTKRAKAYLCLMTTTIIWGISPPIIKYTLNFVNPIEFLAIRFIIVCIIILPIFIIKLKKQPFKLKDLPMLSLVAICGTTLTLGFLFWGLSLTTSLDAAVLASINPLLIVIGGAIFLKEIITKQEKIGLAFAFFGTLIAVVSPLINGSKALHSENIIGNLLIFISNLTWVSYSLFSKKFSKKYSSFNITAFSFFIGLITFTPLLIYQKLSMPEQFFYLPSQAIPGILYMSLFGSVIAYFTYTYGFSLIEASEATLFTYLQPIFTVPLAIIWLKEIVSNSFIVGAIFIVIGVFLTEYRPRKIFNS